jgi:FkbM family methyltransferase
MKLSAGFLRFYRPMYQLAGWLIYHAGPLTPAILSMARRIQNRFFLGSFRTGLPNPIRVDGLHIYHDGRASLEVRLLTMGMFDRQVTALLKEIVKPGMTVLDVGANIGYFSVLAAKLAGASGSVWAFEPTPHVVDILKKNVRANGFEDCIHVVPQAVGDELGSVRLYVNVTENTLSSLYPEASGQQYEQIPGQYEFVDVPCTTVDAWAAQRGWPAVALIKMDIEGGETAALAGMVDVSRHNPRLKLIVEFNVRTLRAAGATIDEFFAGLSSCGFERISAIGDRLQPLHMPDDLQWILHEMQRLGNDSINLLCEKGTT